MAAAIPPRTARGALPALAALLVAVLALMVGVAPAGAHGGDGQMEVTATTRDGDDVSVTVHLSYVADGHGVPDATVTVVVDDGTPVPMTAGAEEGDYTATVPAPPGATIRVTSVEPPVTAEAPAPEDTATTEPTTATDEATTEAPDTSVPTPTTEAAPDEAAAAPVASETEGDDDGSGTGLIVGLVALVVVAGAVAAFFVLRKPTPDA